MDRLLDQLFDALDELGQRSPKDLYNAVWWGMYWFGGVGKYETEGKLPPPPAGRKDKRTIGQSRGHYTLDQLKDRLLTIVDGKERLHEEFAVVSFVRRNEDMLERTVAMYGKGKAKMREDGEFFQSLLDDPEKLADYNERVRERRGKVRPGAPGSEDMTPEVLHGMVDLTKRESVASLTEMRERQESLELWRELTSPIVDPDNLYKYLQQQAFGPLDDD